MHPGYRVVVETLSDEEGGGFLATVPDLPGCMSDGETPEEAMANARDAIEAWKEGALDLGWEIPRPSLVEVEWDDLVPAAPAPSL